MGWYHILDVVMHVNCIGLMGGENGGRGRGRERGRRGKSDLAMINGRYDETLLFFTGFNVRDREANAARQ